MHASLWVVMRIKQNHIVESLAQFLVHSKLSISVRTCFGYIPGKCEDCSADMEASSMIGDLKIKVMSLRGEQV